MTLDPQKEQWPYKDLALMMFGCKPIMSLWD